MWLQQRPLLTMNSHANASSPLTCRLYDTMEQCTTCIGLMTSLIIFPSAGAQKNAKRTTRTCRLIVPSLAPPHGVTNRGALSTFRTATRQIYLFQHTSQRKSCMHSLFPSLSLSSLPPFIYTTIMHYSYVTTRYYSYESCGGQNAWIKSEEAVSDLRASSVAYQCLSCDKSGGYQDQEGQSECKQCPPNSHRPLGSKFTVLQWIYECV